MINFFRQCLLRPFAMAIVLMLVAAPVRADSLNSAEQQHDKLMRMGRALLADGQVKKATVYLSLALRIAPTDISAQLAMAEAFARQGQVRRAEAYFRFLLRDPAQAPNAQIYLKALSQLQGRYPFLASGRLALLPSTNIENTSSQSTFETLLGRFEIDNGGKEASGIGVELGGQGTYRRPLGEGLSLELGAGLAQVWYDEASLRFWRGRMTADVARLSVKDELRGGLHFDRIYYPKVRDNSSDRIAMGGHAAWSHMLGQGRWLAVSGLAEYRNYLDKPGLSGPYATLAVSWNKRQQSGSSLTFGASLARSRPDRSYHRYWGGSLRAGYERNLSATLRAGVSADATLRLYDTDFTAVDYARRDEIYRIGLSISDSRIKIFGATPKLSCSYRVQNSNISLYTMASTDCRIGWAFRF